MLRSCHRVKCSRSAKAGIKLNTTIPYHPALNGIVEHIIGVLTNVVCAMLHDSGLPKDLWAKVFNMVTYIRNRLPMSALKGYMPYEMVYDVKPDLVNLCMFSVPCAIVKPKEKLQKSYDWATLCVFVGYKYGRGGYSIWDPQKSVVVEARDVPFFEEGLP